MPSVADLGCATPQMPDDPLGRVLRGSGLEDRDSGGRESIAGLPGGMATLASDLARGGSNRKGPRFADPLEMWGEALIAKNRSDLALAKFEEASRYAPNWKRLRQKWGEALIYVGRKDEAAKQFALASSLDG